jgi:hypothetical protein
VPFFFREPVTFDSPNGQVRFNDSTTLGDLTSDQAWLDQLDGWTATVKPVVVTSQRAVGDGAYIAKKFYAQGRVLMVGGMIATNSESETEQAWQQLVHLAFPLNEDIRVTHYGPTPMYLDVRVISDVRVTQFMDEGFRFEVDLMSEGSYLLDAINTLSDTAGIVGTSTGGMTFPLTFPLDFNGTSAGEGNVVVLTNIGTAPSRPVVTITGPLDQGWRLENTTTGEFLSFDVALGAGQIMTIDFQTQSADINGSSVTGLVDGDWWDIIPGTNIIKLFGNYYAASTFTVTAKSAWR